MTRDVTLASEWLSRFEGAGLDGVVAKPADGLYKPGKRAMIKVKHARTADLAWSRVFAGTKRERTTWSVRCCSGSTMTIGAL